MCESIKSKKKKKKKKKKVVMIYVMNATCAHACSYSPSFHHVYFALGTSCKDE